MLSGQPVPVSLRIKIIQAAYCLKNLINYHFKGYSRGLIYPGNIGYCDIQPFR